MQNSLKLNECCVTKWGCCCCNCLYRLINLSHPMTDGRSIGEVRGWICSPPEFGRKAFAGWAEHGICEMWERQDSLSKQANAENLKRVFVKMRRSLEPFNDRDNSLIDLISHAETLLEQI